VQLSTTKVGGPLRQPRRRLFSPHIQRDLIASFFAIQYRTTAQFAITDQLALLRFRSFDTQNLPIARSIRDGIPSRVSYHLALVLVCAPFNSLLARPRRAVSSPLLFPSRTHFALTALSLFMLARLLPLQFF
jgi:hypothetical protein